MRVYLEDRQESVVMVSARRLDGEELTAILDLLSSPPMIEIKEYRVEEAWGNALKFPAYVKVVRCFFQGIDRTAAGGTQPV
jgi:hypothetical protein